VSFEPNPVAMAFFFAFIALTLGITYWAAPRTPALRHRRLARQMHLGHEGE
jgi:hypothetical protein